MHFINTLIFLMTLVQNECYFYHICCVVTLGKKMWVVKLPWHCEPLTFSLKYVIIMLPVMLVKHIIPMEQSHLKAKRDKTATNHNKWEFRAFEADSVLLK